MNKYISILLIVAALVGGYILGGAKLGVGGTTNFDAVDASDGIYVDGTAVINGSGQFTLGSGSTFSKISTTTASACTASSSIPGSGTANLECAVSGVQSSDVILLSPGAAASSVYLKVVGAFASSTGNGYVRFLISNTSSTTITTSQDDIRNAELLIVR